MNWKPLATGLASSSASALMMVTASDVMEGGDSEHLSSFSWVHMGDICMPLIKQLDRVWLQARLGWTTTVPSAHHQLCAACELAVWPV